jgi:hypothetical protein
MSPSARSELFDAHTRKGRLHRLTRHTCRACRLHPAKFRFRGDVRADRDHELCFRCFRSMVNSLRARMLAIREAA